LKKLPKVETALRVEETTEEVVAEPVAEETVEIVEEAPTEIAGLPPVEESTLQKEKVKLRLRQAQTSSDMTAKKLSIQHHRHDVADFGWFLLLMRDRRLFLLL